MSAGAFNRPDSKIQILKIFLDPCGAALRQELYHNSSMEDQLEDLERIDVPVLPRHAVYGPLLGAGLIERFDIYAIRGLPSCTGTTCTRTRTCHSQNEVSNKSKNERQLHRQQRERLLLIFELQIGDCLTGHDGIVHGGIISLLMDECCGWGYEAYQRRRREYREDAATRTSAEKSSEEAPKDADTYEFTNPGVTAKLAVNFRQPLRAGVRCVMRVYLEKSTGRKVRLHARLESRGVAVGGTSGPTILYADATCIYIVLKSRL